MSILTDGSFQEDASCSGKRCQQVPNLTSYSGQMEFLLVQCTASVRGVPLVRHDLLTVVCDDWLYPALRFQIIHLESHYIQLSLVFSNVVSLRRILQ